MTDERLRKKLEEQIQKLPDQPGKLKVGSNEQLQEAVDKNDQEGDSSILTFGLDGLTVQPLPEELRQALEKLHEELDKRSKAQGN